MCPLLNDYWINRALSNSDGYCSPTSPYINSSIVLNSLEMFDLVTAISSPTISQSLKSFFTDASNAVASIKMFPIPIRRQSIGPIRYLTTDLKNSNDEPCVGGYVDPVFLQQLKIVFFEWIGRQADKLSWYETTGYSKVFVFLPYYGEVELPATDVINKILTVYRSLSVTGDVMYYITVTRYIDGSNQEERLIAKYSTNIAVDIPLGSSNMHAANLNVAIQAAKGAISIASIAALGAAGGVVSTSAGTAAATTVTSDISESFARGDQPYSKIKKMSETSHTTSVTRNSTFSSSTKIPTSKLVIDGCSAVAQSSINALENFGVKPTSEITKSANLEQFGPHRVIVTVYSPIMHNDNHAHYCGLPLVKEDLVSNYIGFTKLSAFRLENFHPNEATPTLKEIKLLEDILIDGFIIRADEVS